MSSSIVMPWVAILKDPVIVLVIGLGVDVYPGKTRQQDINSST
jgi:hypothetical protein